MKRTLGVIAVLGALTLPALAAPDAAFTYQGRLTDAGAPADGTYAMSFRLFDAPVGGNQIGATVSNSGVAVTDGVFSQKIPTEPNAFNEPRWLEIEVAGVVLSPRTEIAGAPYALSLRGVTLDGDGEYGIGTNDPLAKWHVVRDSGVSVYAFTGGGGPAMYAGTSDPNSNAVYGFNNSGSGTAVRGVVTGGAGSGRGVWGSINVGEGSGIFGEATNSTGLTYGMYGRTLSSGTYASGVYGIAESATGNTRGGNFVTLSASGGASGVVAQALAESGLTYGVQASVSSPDGRAVSGFVGAASGGTAIRGSNNNADGYAGFFLGRVFMRDHTTVGRTGVRVTSAEQFGVHTTAESGQFGGMYVSGQNTGAYPFYGYSTNGTSVSAFHYFDGEQDHWRLVVGSERVSVDRTTGFVGIGDSSPDYPLDMASGARCTVGGTWTNASSRALKHEFEAIDRRAVLETLMTLPITEWSYRTEGDVRHLGPVAEDFARAFGLGDSDAAIGTVDADGVALAAIQGLHEIIEEKDAQIRQLTERLEALERAVGLSPLH
jgi:hypothetical protein